MAGELNKARTKFVDRVSKEVVKQLLDDLLEDGVLNDGEKDSVLEDNSSRADRARCLLDIIKKKGDRASTKMITHIKRRDAELHSELFTNQPVLPDFAEPSKESKSSPPRVKRNENSIYPVTDISFRNRVALLICNKVFTNEKLNRSGAEKDEVNMEKQLTTLGYEVVKYENLTAEEINDALMKFSQHPKLKGTDSVFVVIMSHGKLGAVLGINWKDGDEKPDEFPVNNIYTHLGSQKCPALLNKPKIIIIQACRGEEDGSVLVSDSVVTDDVRPPQPVPSASELDIEDDMVRSVHKEKDFISLLSSTPDTVAYRHKEHGSFLIQFIVDVFNSSSRQDDIEELFRKVMQRFEEFSNNVRQMPTKDRCTLTKHFYLFPSQ
ncbi:caspase a-like [Channa argus]|uniref:caspase a-like n=1 Tax=Channa argus TaxID=215402 RepID=UPI00352134D7